MFPIRLDGNVHRIAGDFEPGEAAATKDAANLDGAVVRIAD